MKILVVPPEKVPEEMEISGSLESMQKVVGGLIQAIYPFEDPVALVCNEEGKLLGLPWNRALYDGDDNLYEIIAGTFFICGIDSDDFCSLTDEQVATYRKRFSTPEVFILLAGQIVAVPAG